MNYRRWLCLGALAAVIGSAEITAGAQEDALRLTEYTVELPGVTEEKKLIFLADLHIVEDNEEIGKEHVETVAQRKELFQNEQGVYSAQLWQEIAKEVDTYETDLLMLGGDILDFTSLATLDCFKQGLDEIKTPFMYVRADHDYAVWYETMEKEEARALHKEIDGMGRVASVDMGEFLVVGVNNNTSQISEEGLKRLEKIFAKGKPIILMVHVPLESKLDQELNELSKEAWQDRALIWGEDTYYTPNEHTQAFLDMVYAKDSPVAAVFAGHLHFSYEGDLTQTVREYVVNPAYLGEGALITVTGTES